MDKSEGTDFISKTFSSISEKVAKLYHKGQKTVSLSSLKRSRNEKLMLLGEKVFYILSQNDSISKESLNSELKSIQKLDEDIKNAEEELEVLDKQVKDMDFSVKTTKKDIPNEETSYEDTALTKESKKTESKKTTSDKPAAKKKTVKKQNSKNEIVKKGDTTLAVVKNEDNINKK